MGVASTLNDNHPERRAPMATTATPRVSHVSGSVKATQNKDGSTTFRVGRKEEGQRFTISAKSPFFSKLNNSSHVLVRFQADGRNPTILLVLEEPSGRLIRQYTADMA